MESSTQKRALGLKDKIPDIRKTLETVQFLRSRDVRMALMLVPSPLPTPMQLPAAQIPMKHQAPF